MVRGEKKQQSYQENEVCVCRNIRTWLEIKTNVNRKDCKNTRKKYFYSTEDFMGEQNIK